MDRPHYNGIDHTHTNSSHHMSNSHGGKSYKQRRSHTETTPSKTKKEVTPDGKQDYDRRRNSGGSGKTSSGGKLKVGCRGDVPVHVTQSILLSQGHFVWHYCVFYICVPLYLHAITMYLYGWLVIDWHLVHQ